MPSSGGLRTWREHTPWTSGSFDYRNRLARESVPSAQDDRTKSKPKKNASLGHRQQPCRPEEAQALATRGLANEGSMQFSLTFDYFALEKSSTAYSWPLRSAIPTPIESMSLSRMLPWCRGDFMKLW